jgi:hypothetical protein
MYFSSRIGRREQRVAVVVEALARRAVGGQRAGRRAARRPKRSRTELPYSVLLSRRLMT